MILSIPYDARMLRSRTALRRAFIDLLDRERFDTISIRDIIREAGISSATFYRHYETKADVLDDIAAQEMTSLIDAAIPVLTNTGTQEAAVALCLYVDQHRKLWSALFTSGAANAMRLAFQNRLRGLPRPPTVLQSKMPDDLRLSVSASGLIEVLTWWLRNGQEFDVETIAGFLHELVVEPGAGRS